MIVWKLARECWHRIRSRFSRKQKPTPPASNIYPMW